MKLNRSILLPGVCVLSVGLLSLVIFHLSRNLLVADKQNELLVGALANVFGVTVGALLAYWFASTQFRLQSQEAWTKALKEAVFNLHREFTTSEMFTMRFKADELIKTHHQQRLDTLYDTLPADKTARSSL